MTRQQWEALSEQARVHGFFASGIVQAGLLKDLHRAIERASEKGTTLEQFKAEVGPKLIKEWAGTVTNPSARMENIFRTNLQRAYAHGRRRQQLEPVVLKVRPYWTLVPVLDKRTSEICQDIARRNVVLPATHVFWKTHVPPLHFQAITGDTLITTSRGRVPAEQVRAGMLALTHRRRWRPVTAVLHKLVRERRVRSLLLASGRRLRVTHEHPVLVLATGANLEWRQAGDLQVGDVVLQHAHQVMRSPGVVIVDADDAPPLGDEPIVPAPVVRNALARRVPFPIDLDAQTLRHKGQIEQEGALWVLDRSATVEKGEQVLLRWGEFLPVGAGLRSHGPLGDPDHVHRVIARHAPGDGRAPDAPGPVVLAAALGDRLRRGDSQYGGISAAAHRDAVVLAPEPQLPVAHAQLALERPDAALSGPVLGLDECCDGGAVGSVEWHGSALISIAEETFNGELCDLSVLDDETYVAGGVLVHNCRTAIRALRLEEAERLGITPRPPKVEPMQGFGGTEEIKADPKGLPQGLAKQVKARNKKPPPPPPKPPVELEPPKPPPTAPPPLPKVEPPLGRVLIRGAAGEKCAQLYPSLNRIWGARLAVQDESVIPIVAPLAKLPEPLMRKLAERLMRIDAGSGGVGNVDSIQYGGRTTKDGRTYETVAGAFDHSFNKLRSGKVIERGQVVVGTVPHGAYEVITHEIGHAVDMLLTYSSARGSAFRAAWEEWRTGPKSPRHIDYMTNTKYGFKEAFADAFDTYHSRGRELAVVVYGEPMIAAMEADIARVSTENG
jgi:hypothetical protein